MSPQTQSIGKLDESIHKAIYDEMPPRLQTFKAKRMKKLRSSTLISFKGMRRMCTRGIAGAYKFMLVRP
ncbi:MAG: hypothetical protein IPH78_09545 [Bacteroidetes bacterium]|jgi:hypothetical protein|nr:hypothetical protein [Bacteroidota bacterium]MBK8659347.1 hypothetical protein [Bacteroidota bacterium]